MNVNKHNEDGVESELKRYCIQLQRVSNQRALSLKDYSDIFCCLINRINSILSAYFFRKGTDINIDYIEDVVSQIDSTMFSRKEIRLLIFLKLCLLEGTLIREKGHSYISFKDKYGIDHRSAIIDLVHNSDEAKSANIERINFPIEIRKRKKKKRRDYR